MIVKWKEKLVKNIYNHYIISILFIFTISIYSCSPSSKAPPKAVKGVLDLRDWDFDPPSTSTPSTPSTGSGTAGTVDTVGRGGTINLDGEWEFYWGEFPKQEEFALHAERRD